jgi:hydroxymethylbilane synthase
MMDISFATRPSALAHWQTNWVIAALQAAWPGINCQVQMITTQGDRVLDRPLPEIGGKGLFTQELEAALVSGQVQAAVHSLKDLPVENTPGLTIGAIPARGEARDVLVSAQGYQLDTLPAGARLGTSSLRRAAQLLAYRPDVQVESLRGNVDTRVRKALDGKYDAILLAGAGVARLGLESAISQYLPLEIMLPAPGQGALAVQCRADDADTQALLAALEDVPTRKSTAAERAFLAALGGGCAAPVAAYAETRGEVITLSGLVASLDGKQVVRVQASGEDSYMVGRACARQALSQGVGGILASEGTSFSTTERHR